MLHQAPVYHGVGGYVEQHVNRAVVIPAREAAGEALLYLRVPVDDVARLVAEGEEDSLLVQLALGGRGWPLLGGPDGVEVEDEALPPRVPRDASGARPVRGDPDDGPPEDVEGPQGGLEGPGRHPVVHLDEVEAGAEDDGVYGVLQPPLEALEHPRVHGGGPLYGARRHGLASPYFSHSGMSSFGMVMPFISAIFTTWQYTTQSKWRFS
ncbi:MAG: hypothetical protein DRP01_10550 [Archaeoglobales archaeon]|nr:MAG: hypothetical protein DRP01_10550 [Archaeoglobales archaeon]